MSQNCFVPSYLLVGANGETELLSGNGTRSVMTIQRHVQLVRSARNRNERAEALKKNKAVKEEEPARRAWRFVGNDNDTADDNEYQTQADVKYHGQGRSIALRPIQPLKLEKGCLDPYNGTGLKINAEIHSLLTYFMAQCISTNFGAAMSCGQHYTSAVQEALSGCLSTPMHMYAVLSATTARLNCASRSHARNRDTFMLPAIQSLRKYLRSCTELSTIKSQVVLDISCLALAELYRQNYDAALAHIRISRLFVKLLDRSHPFDRYVLDFSSFTDVFVAVELANPPIFPLTFDPGPLSDADRQRIDRYLDYIWRPCQTTDAPTTSAPFLSAEPVYSGGFITEEPRAPTSKAKQLRHGRGFTEFFDNGAFTSSLAALIPDLVCWLDVVHYLHLCQEPIRLYPLLWMPQKAISMLHRLMSMSKHIILPGSSTQTTTSTGLRKEHCCRLAITLVLTEIASPLTLTQRPVPRNLVHLRNNLHGIERDWGSKSWNEMLLWVLITGLCTAQAAPHEESWFMVTAASVAFDLDIHDALDLRRLMHLFVYHEMSQHASLMRLADILQLRKKRVKVS